MNDNVIHSTEFGDIAAKAWQVFKDSWKWVGVVAVLSLLASVLMFIVGGAGTNYASSVRNGYFGGSLDYKWGDISTVKLSPNEVNSLVNGAINIAGVALLMGLIVMVAIIVISLMSMVIFNAAYNQESISWGNALRQSGNRFLPAIGTIILLFAIVVPSSILLVGIYLAILWTFAGQVSLFENKGGMQAFHSSETMVRGRWWKTFIYTLVIAVMIWIISAIPDLLFGPSVRNAVLENIVDGTAIPATYYVYSLVQSLLSAVVTMYSLAFSVVMYHAWKNSSRVE